MKTILRRILARAGCLDVPVESLGDSDDLYEAGLTSMGTVRLMLEVEEEFGVAIPPRAITHSLFQSIDALADTLARLAPRQSAVCGR